MTEPTIPAEASRHMAEARAGVYDDDLDPCEDCRAPICQCDRLYDEWREREFDHDPFRP